MKAHYHQHSRAPLVMHVITDHGNGTVTLAHTPDGPPFVTCPLGSKIKCGHATPFAEREPETPAKKRPKPVADPPPSDT